ncbi:sugar transferase [Aequorivita flava]|uniref:Sugar transferase n=1 Tax=Aequorivita flava TaxID=3114371 RepID=A0AB35YUS8_9FLAO
MYKYFFKYIFDMLLVIIGLVVVSPGLIIVSILIRLKLGSPILFAQERPGINGKPFSMYKFRSMTNEKDKEGNLLPNEARLTSFGRKLRSSSLDELPSLLNVLRGEMSIVGPRPLRMRYLELFSPKEYRRHEVRPGITGYAQVNGRSNLNWDKKLEMDVYYVDNLTIWMDIKIIFKTIFNVIGKKDTNPNGADFEIPFDEYIKTR